MGREYHNRRSVQRGRSNPLSQLLVIIITFVLGYFTGTFVDTQTLSHWISTQILAHPEAAKTVSSAPSPDQTANLPKPKFEFYTLLANEKVPKTQVSGEHPATPTTVAKSSAPSAATTAPKSVTAKLPVPAASTATPPERKAYSIQVASFKTRKDAEHMKGLLALKGFNVAIVPINDPHKGAWFRVIVGPYANRTLALKAQIDLARTERLHGMVAME